MGTQLARSELGKEHTCFGPPYGPSSVLGISPQLHPGHTGQTVICISPHNLTEQLYTPTGIASAEIKVGDRERTRNEIAGYAVYAFEIRNVSTHNMPLANAHQHQGSREEGLILGLFTTESTTCPTEMRHNFGRTHGNTRKQRNKMNHKLRRATDTTPL